MSIHRAGWLGWLVPPRVCVGRHVAPATVAALFLVVLPAARGVSGGIVAEAIFQVNSAPPVLFSNERAGFDPHEYELFQKTQVELIKSYFVLQAALRNPDIVSLPILASYDDPVAWLQDNVEVEFLNGSELLAIRLRGAESDADDLRRVVDAVAEAYKDEAVFQERQRRLKARDMKARNLAQLNEELSDKVATLAALKEDVANNYEDTSESPDVQLKQMDVDILQSVYRPLLRSLELDDINYGAPERIHQIQETIVRPD